MDNFDQLLDNVLDDLSIKQTEPSGNSGISDSEKDFDQSQVLNFVYDDFDDEQNEMLNCVNTNFELKFKEPTIDSSFETRKFEDLSDNLVNAKDDGLLDMIFETVLNKQYMLPFINNAVQLYQEWYESNKNNESNEDDSSWQQFCQHHHIINMLHKMYMMEVLNKTQILELFHQLRELGNPPAELMDVNKQLNGLFNFDNVTEELNDILKSDNCLVM
ncbi:hypothetical protein GJ496_011105 [Pomphorhynchus laevis]|nr:hypothetical protein GJ496_011105 [Pomphorhynchus laevis]